MKKTIKITSLILAILFILLSFTSCFEVPVVEISDLKIEDISNTTFIKDATSESLKLTVLGTADFSVDDVEVVIEHNNILQVNMTKEKKLLSGPYISYTITGLEAGTTSIYFKTTDGSVKSEKVEITIVDNIKSIKFSDTSDIEFYWGSTETVSFNVESHSYIENLSEELSFISENEDVATVEGDFGLFSNNCVITKVSPGTTYIYIQTKDGRIQSEKIKVIIPEEEEETTETYVEETEKSGITVYTTPTGSKYHYSSACAGKNARARDLDDVKDVYEPCKKCS